MNTTLQNLLRADDQLRKAGVSDQVREGFMTVYLLTIAIDAELTKAGFPVVKPTARDRRRRPTTIDDLDALSAELSRAIPMLERVAASFAVDKAIADGNGAQLAAARAHWARSVPYPSDQSFGLH